MSSISVAGDTSGSITISAPLVAGSGTLTLPVATDTLIGKATTDTLTNKSIAATQLTGTIAASALPAGSVLQVVTFKYSTGQTFASVASFSWQDTGLTASITPSSASNKVLVLVSAMHNTSYLSGNTGSGLSLKRTSPAGATAITQAIGIHGGTQTNSEVFTPTGGMVVLDSPASTSSVTYTVRITVTAAATATCYFNRNYAYASGYDSFITLMEIAG